MDLEQLKLDLIRDEGIEKYAYKDTKDIETIGVGINLNRKDSIEILKNLGYNIEELKKGNQTLSKATMSYMLELNASTAEKEVRSTIKNYDELPENKQRALTNMMFNLGKTRFKKFKNMINAINNKDYEKASKEMLNSKWAKEDVPNRATRINTLFNQK